MQYWAIPLRGSSFTGNRVAQKKPEPIDNCIFQIRFFFQYFVTLRVDQCIFFLSFATSHPLFTKKSRHSRTQTKCLQNHRRNEKPLNKKQHNLSPSTRHSFLTLTKPRKPYRWFIIAQKLSNHGSSHLSQRNSRKHVAHFPRSSQS